ncbi:uncharacterized protein LOC126671990 [Mercurialis annua]|uniref:uncharacterized protein LOC126671990 n=1 Tax=Mercurialis annua TaxID=3986 RepID=UPI00215EE254|nr:uncharacterized protein LOC126671990 [Mercurialis annua]
MHPITLSSQIFYVKILHFNQNAGFNRNHNKFYTKISALKKDEFDGKLIDENMFLLRKRIQEMKIMERNSEAPSDWMEWEKKYYAHYNSDVCEAVGILQSVLMNTRPSFALAMVFLFMLSMPTSLMIIMCNLWGWSNGFFM